MSSSGACLGQHLYDGFAVLAQLPRAHDAERLQSIHGLGCLTCDRHQLVVGEDHVRLDPRWRARMLRQARSKS